jgi:hypothetical protein
VQAQPHAFALNPAGAGEAPWDFQTSAGMKQYIAATAPLAVPYDGVEAGLTTFLRDIAARAKTFGLDIVLKIADDAGIIRSLTSEFGCLTLENIQEAAQVYMVLENRARQASNMLSTLLMASITGTMAARLSNRKQSYTLRTLAAGAVPQIMEISGACMLAELIS